MQKNDNKDFIRCAIMDIIIEYVNTVFKYLKATSAFHL